MSSASNSTSHLRCPCTHLHRHPAVTNQSLYPAMVANPQTWSATGACGQSSLALLQNVKHDECDGSDGSQGSDCSDPDMRGHGASVSPCMAVDSRDQAQAQAGVLHVSLSLYIPSFVSHLAIALFSPLPRRRFVRRRCISVTVFSRHSHALFLLYSHSFKGFTSPVLGTITLLTLTVLPQHQRFLLAP